MMAKSRNRPIATRIRVIDPRIIFGIEPDIQSTTNNRCSHAETAEQIINVSPDYMSDIPKTILSIHTIKFQ